MQITIQSADAVIYKGDIRQASIKTTKGDITIMPHHVPMVAITQAGLIKIWPSDSTADGVIQDDFLYISADRGIIYTDGHQIKILCSVASTSPSHSKEVLETMRIELQKQLAEVKHYENPDEYMDILNQIEKINADIKLGILSQ